MTEVIADFEAADRLLAHHLGPDTTPRKALRDCIDAVKNAQQAIIDAGFVESKFVSIEEGAK